MTPTTNTRAARTRTAAAFAAALTLALTAASPASAARVGPLGEHLTTPITCTTRAPGHDPTRITVQGRYTRAQGSGELVIRTSGYHVTTSRTGPLAWVYVAQVENGTLTHAARHPAGAATATRSGMWTRGAWIGQNEPITAKVRVVAKTTSGYTCAGTWTL